MAVKLAAALRPDGGQSFADLAAKAREVGFRCLALPFEPGWDQAQLLDLREACDRAGVELAALDCHCNFLTPREDEVRENFARLGAALRAGALLNSNLVITHAGSRHPDPSQPYAPHPENWADKTWDTLIQRIWALLDEVEDNGVCLCFEPRPTTTLNTLEALAELVADATSVRVRIALDPAAIMTGEAGRESGRALAEIFGRLADTIRAAYATDLEVVEAGEEVRARPVPLGQGCLDYPTYLKLLDALREDTPLIVRARGSGAACRRAREFLAHAAEQAGINLA